MTTFLEQRDRKILPDWRRFDKTSRSGELNNTSNKQKIKNKSDIVSLNNYVEEWRKNKNIFHAGDLLGAYMSNGLESDLDTEDAASYLLESEKSTDFQKKIALLMLGSPKAEPTNKITSVNNFIIESSREIIYSQINNIKKRIISIPNDFVNYVELARLYSIIGNQKKASEKMHIALTLSNSDRYVLRSAARFLVHSQKIDEAHNLLRKNPTTKFDPWLLASEIGISSLLGKSSNNIKRGIDILKSNNFTDLSLTELASAIGTVEFMNGSMKSSRSYFTKSLLMPNSNSLAQAEWVSEKGNIINVDVNRSDVVFNYEARTLDHINRKDWNRAIIDSENWFLDMPFTKHPLLLGNHVAMYYLEDHSLAINFCKAGLIAHPNDDHLLNNIAYSLAVMNKCDEAQKYIDQAKVYANENIRICLLATQGLVFFRRGFADVGRIYYRQAIEKANEIKNTYLAYLACINYAKEEIQIKSEFTESAMSLVSLVKELPNNPEIKKLKDDVIKMYVTMKVDQSFS